jgi:hypothetical protein
MSRELDTVSMKKERKTSNILSREELTRILSLMDIPPV